jgi:hypothetical protein
MLRALEAQTQNVDIVETGFTDREDTMFFDIQQPTVVSLAAVDFISEISQSRSIT